MECVRNSEIFWGHSEGFCEILLIVWSFYEASHEILGASGFLGPLTRQTCNSKAKPKTTRPQPQIEAPRSHPTLP